MGPKLREEKKKEVLEYLEESANCGPIDTLEKRRIAQDLSDEHYSEDTINELIDELETDGLVSTKTARLKIVYPESHKESIEGEYQDLLTTPILSKFVLGFLAYMLLLEWDIFYRTISSEVLYPREAHISLGILALISSFTLGSMILETYQRAQERITIIKKYQNFIYSICIIGTIAVGLIYLSSIYLGQEVRLSHVVAIISVSVVGGVPLGIHLSDKGSSK